MCNIANALGEKMIKSGTTVIDGTRGVFITEDDLARAGDAVRFLVRTNYKAVQELEESGYNLMFVMHRLLDAQKNNTAYEVQTKTFIESKTIDIVYKW